MINVFRTPKSHKNQYYHYNNNCRRSPTGCFRQNLPRNPWSSYYPQIPLTNNHFADSDYTCYQLLSC